MKDVERLVVPNSDGKPFRKPVADWRQCIHRSLRKAESLGIHVRVAVLAVANEVKEQVRRPLIDYRTNLGLRCIHKLNPVINPVCIILTALRVLGMNAIYVHYNWITIGACTTTSGGERQSWG